LKIRRKQYFFENPFFEKMMVSQLVLVGLTAAYKGTGMI